ncbi:hypothetical protein [Streptomyces canus]|uniref:hypothetical protein n=1 Tax=Streptomyces canus TaxID=58343 RepID=UPI00386CD7E7|nr:hypothetical protein OH824_14290 [Streptomyces canus]
MADDVTITVHVRDLTGPGFNSVNRNINQLQRNANQAGGSLTSLGNQLGGLSDAASGAGQSLGRSGGGLTGQLIGVGAALGTSVLPAIGAAAPMLVGLAAVAGPAALAMDGLKKQAKELKGPFDEWRKTAEKAVLPHTAKAIDTLKGAMKDLNPAIKIGGDTFGRIAENAAKFADSPAFKSSLLTNVKMGSQFFEGLSGSVGDFTQAFLDFGTKSQPSLDAFQNLFGGLLDTGLPGMFKGLEQGIGGASDVIDGFAYLLNDSLLPSLGKISGSFANAFGPLIGEMLITVGKSIEIMAREFEGLMPLLKPLGDLLADSFRALNVVLPIAADAAASLASNLGGALLESLASLAGINLDNLDGFTGLSDWAKANQGQIRKAFYDAAEAITDFVTTGISTLPTLYTAFRTVTEGILTGIDIMVSGLATAFGGIPGLGDKFQEWNRNFDDFAAGARSGLDDVGNGIDSFVGEAVPRMSRVKLKMNVDEAVENLAYLKEQLKDPDLTKERRAKLTADKRAAEAAVAAAKGDLARFDRHQANAKLGADATGFWGTIRRAAGAKIPGKSANVSANTNPFWGAVRSMQGRVVGTSYINVVQRAVGKVAGMLSGHAAGGMVRGYAGGGNVQAYPDGGFIQGPGSGTSDSIVTLLGSGNVVRSSNTEFIVNAKETAKHRGLLEMINSGQLPRFAKGGKVTKAEAQARHDAMGNLTVSHFGQMAGYSRSEFASGLGSPDSVSSLVNALNQWRGVILKATHGGQEKGLLRALDSTGKKLLGWEKQLGTVTKSLEAAKTKLNDLKSAAASLASSVKSGVLGSANITKGASGDGLVTTSSVMAGLTASRDKATAFAGALKQLKGKGLRSDLIQQIGEAGIEGGGLETAGALLGASSSEISSVNDLQKQITSAATSAGKVTSDAVYAAQIKAQDALVKKLGSQQDKLIKSMDKLAKSMERLVEKAFGKKAAGGIVGAAASGGVRGGLTWVGEHEPELLQLPVGSRVWSGPDSRRKAAESAPWASMLTAPRRPAPGYAQPAAAGGGSGQPLVIQLRIGEREFGEVWVDAGRKAVRDRGGIEATLRPPRGR